MIDLLEKGACNEEESQVAVRSRISLQKKLIAPLAAVTEALFVGADVDLTMCRNSVDQHRACAEVGKALISILLAWSPIFGTLVKIGLARTQNSD